MQQGGDEENDDDVSIAGCTAKDYDYLLGMPMWSLTLEKVCIQHPRARGHMHTCAPVCLQAHTYVNMYTYVLERWYTNTEPGRESSRSAYGLLSAACP